MSGSGTADTSEFARALVRFNAHVLGVTGGLMASGGLFVATLLLLQGGEQAGNMLGQVRYFFPGYSVTWRGSLIGFGYGAAAGAFLGYSVAALYNRLAGRRVSVERVGRPKGRRSS